MKKNHALQLILPFLLVFLRLTPGNSAESAKDQQQQTNDASLPVNPEEWSGKTVLIPITGVIGPEKLGGQEEEIIRTIKLATNAERIILKINSPGGVVDSCDHICNALINSPAPTIALVTHKAVSGGAMVATACEKIYMLSGSRIGDIQPMQMLSSQNLDDRTAEKAEADIRAIMAANARHNGYPKVLLEAMVSRSFEIYEVNFNDGNREFLKKPAYELLRKNMEEGIDERKFNKPPQIVVTEGKLLSVEAQTAAEYGIATAVIGSENELFELLSINPDKIINVNINEGELNPLKLLNFKEWEMSRGLIMLLVFCLIVGIAGSFTEMSIPGFGLPGALGLIGFASFFTILFMHQRASILEIGIFIIGIILLIVEIVLIPGFGIAGVLGLICLLGGLLFSLVPSFDTTYMEINSGGEMMFAALITGSVLVVSCILLLILMERGGKSKFFKFMFLEKNLPTGRAARKKGIETDKTAAELTEKAHNELLGMTAVAYTPLRPSGKIKLNDGRLLDVITPGDYIDKGTTVKIIAVDMNRILVDLPNKQL